MTPALKGIVISGISLRLIQIDALILQIQCVKFSGGRSDHRVLPVKTGHSFRMGVSLIRIIRIERQNIRRIGISGQSIRSLQQHFFRMDSFPREASQRQADKHQKPRRRQDPAHKTHQHCGRLCSRRTIQLFHFASSILYPRPHTDFRYRGEAGSYSIFSRRCRIWTATIFSVPYGSSFHTFL